MGLPSVRVHSRANSSPRFARGPRSVSAIPHVREALPDVELVQKRTKPPGHGAPGAFPFAAVQTPQRLIHHNRSMRTITSPTSTATSCFRGPAASSRTGSTGFDGRSWVGSASGGDGSLRLTRGYRHPPASP